MPCGIVARITKEIFDSGKKTFIYSNKGLAEYAEEVTRELMHEEFGKEWIKEKAKILRNMIKSNPEFAKEKAEDFISSLLKQTEIGT